MIAKHSLKPLFYIKMCNCVTNGPECLRSVEKQHWGKYTYYWKVTDMLSTDHWLSADCQPFVSQLLVCAFIIIVHWSILSIDVNLWKGLSQITFVSIVALITTSIMSSGSVFFPGGINQSVKWSLYWTRRKNCPVKWHKWFYFKVTWSIQWISRIYTYHSFEPKTRR